MVFCFVQKFIFGQHESLNIVLTEFNIRLYDKNSESNYFFSSTKIRIFVSATLGIRIIFFRKITIFFKSRKVIIYHKVEGIVNNDIEKNRNVHDIIS